MQTTLKMPSYEELVELSNSELMKRIRMSRDAVILAYKHRQPITEKEQIYKVYENERLKRLQVAKH